MMIINERNIDGKILTTIEKAAGAIQWVNAPIAIGIIIIILGPGFLTNDGKGGG